MGGLLQVPLGGLTTVNRVVTSKQSPARRLPAVAWYPSARLCGGVCTRGGTVGTPTPFSFDETISVEQALAVVVT